MLIDWYTVGAQVLNFLILVYLLKRFLYGPIVRSMDRREERVAGRLREAAEKSEEAARQSADLERRHAELAEKRDALLKEAVAEAEEKKKEFIEEVRREAEEARALWREEIAAERDGFVTAFTRKAGKEILSLSNRALRDLTGRGETLSMIEVFLDRLRKLEPAERERLASGAAKESLLSVRTSSPLDEGVKGKVAETVRETSGFAGDVMFSVDGAMSPGIELLAGGVRVAWSVDDYLEDLEEILETTIDEASLKPTGEK